MAQFALSVVSPPPSRRTSLDEPRTSIGEEEEVADAVAIRERERLEADALRVKTLRAEALVVDMEWAGMM